MENVMPTVKKASDYHPRTPRNLIKLPSKVATRFRELEISQIFRRDLRFAEKSPQGESRAGIASALQERSLSAEIHPKKPCTLMVADDHPVVREGLVAMIDRQFDMRVVAQASNGREAVDQFMARRPDVGILDLRMPGMDGVDAVIAICEKDPAARLIILTTYQAQEEIYRALRAGALCYLLKDAPADELIESIRAVSRGKTWIPPAVGAKLAQCVTDRQLTAREMEVLRILAVGKSNKEIGVAFNISEATVKVHVTHILEKLKVTGRTEAINVAVRRGLVNMDSTAAA
jgi:two-component system, NarL family, response regulator